MAGLKGAVPERTSICLTCRTALRTGESCDVDAAHVIASLDTTEGRELLVQETWGPPAVRLVEARSALHAEHAVALLALFGFVAGLCALWLLLPGVGPLHVLGAALTMALFWGGGNLLLARRGSTFPVGAPPLLPGATDRLGLSGAVLGALAITSPASGIECVAFAIELHFVGYWGDRLMYRDAVTSGFDVMLGDGRVARVPAGRVRLVGAMRQVIDVDNLTLEQYLAQVDREHEPGRPFDPLRYNVVSELLVLTGDQVELLSRLEPEPSARAMPAGYRDPAPAVWIARGVPVLRLAGR